MRFSHAMGFSALGLMMAFGACGKNQPPSAKEETKEPVADTHSAEPAVTPVTAVMPTASAPAAQSHAKPGSYAMFVNSGDTCAQSFAVTEDGELTAVGVALANRPGVAAASSPLSVSLARGGVLKQPPTADPIATAALMSSDLPALDENSQLPEFTIVRFPGQTITVKKGEVYFIELTHLAKNTVVERVQGGDDLGQFFGGTASRVRGPADTTINWFTAKPAMAFQVYITPAAPGGQEHLMVENIWEKPQR